MIRVRVRDPAFNLAYLRAFSALPVWPLESPGQYGARWQETYRCRVDPSSKPFDTYYVFDRDEDYTWFMLRWS